MSRENLSGEDLAQLLTDLLDLQRALRRGLKITKKRSALLDQVLHNAVAGVLIRLSPAKRGPKNRRPRDEARLVHVLITKHKAPSIKAAAGAVAVTLYPQGTTSDVSRIERNYRRFKNWPGLPFPFTTPALRRFIKDVATNLPTSKSGKKEN